MDMQTIILLSVGVLTIGAMIYFIIKSKNDSGNSSKVQENVDVQQREEIIDEDSNYTTVDGDGEDESIFDS